MDFRKIEAELKRLLPTVDSNGECYVAVGEPTRFAKNDKASGQVAHYVAWDGKSSEIEIVSVSEMARRLADALVPA
jgi:hypothetical protein